MSENFYIATSHGSYAESTISTLKMITGESMPFISFYEEMSKKDLKKKYLEIFKNNCGKEFIVFVDILGGTPFNVLAEIKYEQTDLNIALITGFSLVMIIEVLENGVTKKTLENIFEMTKIIEKFTINSEEGEEED